MSVFVRSRKPLTESEKGCPRQFHNYEVVIDEKGISKCVKKDVVAPSLAADFDVLSLAVLRGDGDTLPIRENIDPVDMFDNHPELLNL